MPQPLFLIRGGPGLRAHLTTTACGGSGLAQLPINRQSAIRIGGRARAADAVLEDGEILEIDVVYPQSGFNPYDDSFATLRLKLLAKRSTRILLAGLLGREFVELSGEAVSELQVR